MQQETDDMTNTMKTLAAVAILAATPVHADMPFQNGTGKIAFGIGLVATAKHDKLQHYGAGLAVAGVGQKLGLSFWERCALTFGVGVLKEVADSQFGGVVDAKDALATGAGCLTVTLKF